MNGATARTVVLVAAISSLAAPRMPCMCVSWPPGATHPAPFLSVAPGADLVLVGEVLRHVAKRHTKRRIPEAMEAAVREVLAGTDRRPTIRVRGDNGVLCRPYVTKFPIGATWIPAVHEAPEKRGEYAISGCGEYWLAMEGDRVRGYIHPDPNQTAREVEMGLAELKGSLSAAGGRGAQTGKAMSHNNAADEVRAVPTPRPSPLNSGSTDRET